MVLSVVSGASQAPPGGVQHLICLLPQMGQGSISLEFLRLGRMNMDQSLHVSDYCSECSDPQHVVIATV